MKHYVYEDRFLSALLDPEGRVFLIKKLTRFLTLQGIATFLYIGLVSSHLAYVGGPIRTSQAVIILILLFFCHISFLNLNLLKAAERLKLKTDMPLPADRVEIKDTFLNPKVLILLFFVLLVFSFVLGSYSF